MDLQLLRFEADLQRMDPVIGLVRHATPVNPNPIRDLATAVILPHLVFERIERYT